MAMLMSMRMHSIHKDLQACGTGVYMFRMYALIADMSLPSPHRG